MPGFLVPVGTQVLCGHPGGIGVIPPSQTRVLVGGKPAATVMDQVDVLTCQAKLGPSPAPCVKVAWPAPPSRVMLSGKAALTQDMTGTTIGPAGPQNVAIPLTQSKVRGA